MILQGDPYNLQGSVPNIQGGQTATVLQPASSPTPASVAPIPKPVATPKPAVQAAPKAAAPATGAVFYKPDLNSMQVYNAQGQALSYDQYIAQGGKTDWSNVINSPIPGQPTAQPTAQPAQTFSFGNGQTYDINGQPVQQQQGASPVPTTPPAIPTGSSLDPNQARIGELAKQVFQAPTINQQKLYEDAYNAAGLSTVRTRLEELNKQIADKQAAYTSKEGDINENPFLSEASRIGRLKRLNDQKQAEVGNLLDQYKQYADLYNSGIDEVNKSVERQVGDFNTQRQVGTEELNYLLGIEKTQADNKAALQKSADTFAKDNNITSRFYKYPGSNTVYDSTTREPLTYEQYVARGGTGKPGAAFPDVQTLSSEGNLKDYPASYQEYLLAKKDGFTGTYNDYQNLDANRKISIARAGASVIGNSSLNSKEATIFNGIIDKYNKSPLIAAADKMRGYLTTIESAGQGQSTPQKDLNLIYAYIKALDYGESAVREGEINLGMDTGSIKQQLNAKIQKLSGGGLLDPSQRQNYISAARELIAAVNAAAQAKEKSFASQAQVTGVGDAWNQFRSAIQTSYDQPTQGGGQSGVNLNDLF